MAFNVTDHKISEGSYVEFPYRKNASLKLTGYVISVLENTIIVDISEMNSFLKLGIDMRQVVRHGHYKKIPFTSSVKVEKSCTFSM